MLGASDGLDGHSPFLAGESDALAVEDAINQARRGSFGALSALLASQRVEQTTQALSSLLPIVAECYNGCVSEKGQSTATAAAAAMPPSSAREALRVIQSKVRVLPAESLLVLLCRVLQCIEGGARLSQGCIDLLPHVISRLAAYDHLVAPDGDQRSRSYVPVQVGAKVFEAIISVVELHPENIVPLIVAMRESPMVPPQSLVSLAMKRLEDVPAKALPAAIYQSLLWLRGTSHLHACLETIFALLEATNDRTNDNECIAHIRLAIDHDKGIGSALLKYARVALRGVRRPSHLSILLIVSMAHSSESLYALIEAYLYRQISTNSRLAQVGPIHGCQLDQRHVDVCKLFSRTIRAIPEEDADHLAALMCLGRMLIRAKKRGTDNVTAAIRETGAHILLVIFKEFSCAQEELLRVVMEDFVLASSLHVKPAWMATLKCILEECSSTKSMAFPRSTVISVVMKKSTDRGELFLRRLAEEGACSNILAEHLLSHSVEETSLHSLDIVPGLCHRDPTLLIGALVQSLRAGEGSLWTFGLLERAFASQNIDWAAAYAKVVPLAPEVACSTAGSLFAFLYGRFRKLCDGDKLCDWPSIVKRCVDPSTLQTTEALPVLLYTIAQTFQHIQDGSLSSDEMHQMCGSLNYLCEILCHDIQWLERGDDEAWQVQLQPIILGLYDVCILHIASSSDLDDEGRTEAWKKLLAKRLAFFEQSRSTVGSSEAALPVITYSAAGQLLTTALATNSAPLVMASEILHLPWVDPALHGLGDEAMACLAEVLSRLCRDESMLGEGGRRRAIRDCLAKMARALPLIRSVRVETIDQLSKGMHRLMQRDSPTSKEAHTLLRIVESLLERAAAPLDGPAGEGEAKLCTIGEHFDTLARNWKCSSGVEIPLCQTIGRILLNSDRRQTGRRLVDLCREVASIFSSSAPREYSSEFDEIYGERARKEGADYSEHLSAPVYAFVCSRSTNVLLGCVMEVMTARIADCSWLIEEARGVGRECVDNVVPMVSHVLGEFAWLSKAADILVRGVFSSGEEYCMTNSGSFLQVLQDLFKEFIATCKLMLTTKVPVPDVLCGCARLLADGVTGGIYAMLPALQHGSGDAVSEKGESGIEVATGKAGGGKNNSRRRLRNLSIENRLIPTLIYQVEAFEQAILALCTMHQMPIVKHFHRSTARDFRIQLDVHTLARDQHASGLGNDEHPAAGQDGTGEDSGNYGNSAATCTPVISIEMETMAATQ